MSRFYIFLLTSWFFLTNGVVYAESSAVELQSPEIQKKLQMLSTEEVTVSSDPAYHDTRVFTGYSVEALLSLLPGVLEGATLEFIASDGYKIALPIAELKKGSAVLAFKDNKAPRGKNFSLFLHNGKKESPEPYYLVWPNSEDGSPRQWPYKIVSLRVLMGSLENSVAYPKEGSERVIQGFHLFQQHCSSCHSVNLIGGNVGPELSVPLNVTEYWQREYLLKFIENPASVRSHSRMPTLPQVTTNDRERIFEYFSFMATKKICTTAQECATRENNK